MKTLDLADNEYTSDSVKSPNGINTTDNPSPNENTKESFAETEKRGEHVVIQDYIESGMQYLERALNTSHEVTDALEKRMNEDSSFASIYNIDHEVNDALEKVYFAEKLDYSRIEDRILRAMAGSKSATAQMQSIAALFNRLNLKISEDGTVVIDSLPKEMQENVAVKEAGNYDVQQNIARIRNRGGPACVLDSGTAEYFDMEMPFEEANERFQRIVHVKSRNTKGTNVVFDRTEMQIRDVVEGIDAELDQKIAYFHNTGREYKAMEKNSGLGLGATAAMAAGLAASGAFQNSFIPYGGFLSDHYGGGCRYRGYEQKKARPGDEQKKAKRKAQNKARARSKGKR